ncbi:NADPH2:quinone reductase [Phyllobacterium sp. 1468]|uniref:quinone oxidoreductase family protein n=1 Tax=Phyllobacterium sp. 1468 TaxID=2817759 RepID=UPI002858026F|nr:zinc-binding dehydrogenase [Phyllobacterium sp. 1468]MDR6632616.1 NADPH2:quinone reductase [Phyllobacterium sp. 1468]
MKTVRFHKTGGPEVLTYEDVPDPRPRPGQVLIKVEAVGVNFADVLRRRGDPYPMPSPTPFTLGGEIAGTVAELGEGVSGISVGSFVYVTCREGGYAQYLVAPASTVVPLPAGIGPKEATTLVIQGLTAALAIKDSGRLTKGEIVLIEAAAGGVGSFAVQLAKLYGAGKVIAAASTPEKRALAIELGADLAVDYTDPNWASAVKEMTGGHGADIVLEMTGGETLPRAVAALASFGRMIVYGLASAEQVTVDPQDLVTSNQSITGFYIGGYFAERPELVKSELSELVRFVGEGRLKLPVGTVLPLSQAAQAHRLLEGRKTTGKTILEPWAA